MPIALPDPQKGRQSTMRTHLFIISFILLFAMSASAHARAGREPLKSSQPDDPSKGFEMGLEVNALMGIGGETLTAPYPGKVDLILGYRFNPAFSLSADLWSFWFLAYGAEIKPKVNLMPGKISPFLAATIGIAGSPFDFDEEEGGIGPILTYSAGPGLDVRLGERTVLTMNGRYRGAALRGEQESDAAVGHGLEFGMGMQFNF